MVGKRVENTEEKKGNKKRERTQKMSSRDLRPPLVLGCGIPTTGRPWLWWRTGANWYWREFGPVTVATVVTVETGDSGDSGDSGDNSDSGDSCDTAVTLETVETATVATGVTILTVETETVNLVAGWRADMRCWRDVLKWHDVTCFREKRWRDVLTWHADVTGWKTQNNQITQRCWDNLSSCDFLCLHRSEIFELPLQSSSSQQRFWNLRAPHRYEQLEFYLTCGEVKIFELVIKVARAFYLGVSPFGECAHPATTINL
jgi:hypothetical protein